MGSNLTHFGTKPTIPDVLSLCVYVYVRGEAEVTRQKYGNYDVNTVEMTGYTDTNCQIWTLDSIINGFSHA